MFALKTAFRYAFSRTRGQRTTSIVIMLGIAAGLIALLVVSAVMNGLQTAQLDQLRNLESFDIIVKDSAVSAEELQSIDGVDKAFSFLETSALVVDKSSGKSSSARIRAFDTDVYSYPRLSQSLNFRTSFSFEDFPGLSISYTMANSLSLYRNDNIEVTFLKHGKTATIVPYTKKMTISSYFTSGMTEFSSSTVFMDYNDLLSIIGEQNMFGMYISGNQKKIVNQIHSIDPNARIITWQEYNKALYSALMLEKSLMYVFLAFMFLIICVNLKNSTRRLLRNKQKEGAMLRALGSTRNQINFIFLAQGLLICLLGEAIGVILGKAIISNIQSILSFADKVITALTGRRTVLALIPFNASINGLEIFVVCLFVFALSTLFTTIGCKKIHKNEIMEVILHASY